MTHESLAAARAAAGGVLGQFDITPQGYAAITRVIVRLADELCQGKVVSVLEGGYRLDGLGESVAAHVAVLSNGS